MMLVGVAFGWNDCTSSQAPFPYSRESCHSVCVDLGGGTLECDIETFGGTTGGDLFASTEYASGYISVWGTDASGDDFCCAAKLPGAGGVITMKGTIFGDTIALGDASYGYCAEYMDTRTFAEEGNDVVTARCDSGLGGNLLVEGDDGVDWIDVHPYKAAFEIDLRGGAQNDYIRGSTTSGTLFDGGAGNDTLVGGNASDIMVGGIGNDSISGAGGPDAISGDEGNDTINGGAGDDVLCSGPSAGGAGDSIIPGTGSNVLWAPSGASVTASASSIDDCAYNGLPVNWAGTSCAYVVATEPSSCP
ncbi:MAG: calcium-binding protein [Myxococcota bacterium]